MFGLVFEEQVRTEDKSAIFTHLRWRAPITTSLSSEGNMLVKCAISASEGTRSPTFARSRLVNSSIHSLMTDVVGWGSSPRSPSALEVRAVVIISSFWGARSPCWLPLRLSGKALFDLRGGRREPMSGAMYFFDNRMIVGGNRYVFNPARSER